MNTIKSLLLAAAVACTSPFATAQNDPAKPAAPGEEVVTGAVAKISASSVTLKTPDGEKTFAVSPSTVIRNVAAIADIQVGANIAIRTTADRTGAALINAKPGAPEPPAAPTGDVTGGAVVKISASSITLKTPDGEKTFVVSPSTVIRNATGIADIHVGANVAVRMTADKTGATVINAKP